ncbi:Reverse transcriptase domain [Trinorchestia longiramus]|nr:Reverse transcriptase domain [Trinorchestia longiramus]
MDDITKSLNVTLAHTLADEHCFLCCDLFIITLQSQPSNISYLRADIESLYLTWNEHLREKHTSTQDALLNITEKMYSDIDNKNVTLLLLLDLSKAFDSVEHTRLLQKISYLAIATQWFQSYLTVDTVVQSTCRVREKDCLLCSYLFGGHLLFCPS